MRIRHAGMVSDPRPAGRKRGVKIGPDYAAFTRGAPGFTTIFTAPPYRGSVFHHR
jgi:hypothetical protein